MVRPAQFTNDNTRRRKREQRVRWRRWGGGRQEAVRRPGEKQCAAECSARCSQVIRPIHMVRATLCKHKQHVLDDELLSEE